MKTKLAPLTSEQRAALWRCINTARRLRLIAVYDRCFKARARAAFRRNLAESNDRNNYDLPMLAALAVAEAYTGRGAGWIFAVQQAAYRIVSAPGF